MKHALMLVLCLCGFALLALTMDRHQQALWGRELALGSTRMLRWGGWLLLIVALAWALRGDDWPRGLVAFSGHTSLAAGLVYGALLLQQRWHARRSQS